ncbi:hypothetical protein F383_37584 [Gossypium arboreum]|uniref:Uncharacterized protein n=1 Tax=Gossypium arboreum TaxID=29729 RepID=A0A0B0MCH6_GOSAR|nr:hypothetical protein F383_37584 [Gossypium arboreum]
MLIQRSNFNLTVISELTLVNFAFFLLSRDFWHNVNY